ncbi:MAG: hypothetical protein Q9219_002575 [cf. Caloplaca sp. 3 TL-2023]
MACQQQPVTITLKRGDSNNLQTVSLITGSATGKSFTWNVPRDLPNGDDYALQINQGVDDVNYSGRFTLSGGSTASITSPTAATASSTLTSAGTSASAIIQSAINSQNSSITTTVALGNATTTTLGGAFGTGAVGSGAVGSGASGAATGTTMLRNTTMSRPTLRSTSSVAETTSAATTTTGEEAGSTSSSTGAPSSGAMDAASFASPLALIFSAIAAMVYLG